MWMKFALSIAPHKECDMKHDISGINFNSIGQILLDYVCWILHEAQRQGISKLYFLARDGYLLYRIADKICRKKSIPIECKYLYCSRMALRLPSYHLIGDEAYDLLLLGSYHPTLHSLLARIKLDLPQRKLVYEAIGASAEQENRELNNNEFLHFTEQLRGCSLYQTFVQEKSREVYPDAIGYLRQEGLLDQSYVAIVDSGWSGSMQRSLRQLLESAGFHGKTIGFYFGIFRFQRREPADGEYCCWYFSPSNNVLNQLRFSNNVFECILSAPHGMTLGYRKTGNDFIPVLKDGPPKNMQDLILFQGKEILRSIESEINDIKIDAFDEKAAQKRTARAVRRLMAYPTRAEAQFFSRFLFCDDVAEGSFLSLGGDGKTLRHDYLLIPRIWRKLTRASDAEVNCELYWPYGTAAFLKGRLKRLWYVLNIFLWDYLKWIRYQKRK